MQLEEFFNTFSFICIKVLPFLGAILLVYLIIMVKNLIACLKSATKTLDESTSQLRKLDVPLHTVAEISKSVDQVHDMTKESIKSLSLNLYQSIHAIKVWLANALHQDEKESKTADDVINQQEACDTQVEK